MPRYRHWLSTVLNVRPSMSSRRATSKTLNQHTLPDVGTSFGDSQLLTTIAPTKVRDQDVNMPPRCSGMSLEQAALDTQHNLGIETNVAPFEAVLLPPVTRLPVEILAYIFELSLVDGSEPTAVLVSAQGPFHLAQVCKLWRAVAESDPHLWTSIRVYLCVTRQSRDQELPRIRTLLDLHLKRSRALPISLTFTDHRSYHATTGALVALLVDRLQTHSCRWKRISLHLPCGYFPLLFSFMPCDLSSLEHLHISGDVLGHRTITTLRLNLESARKLKSFSYSGPGYVINDRIDLAWERLAEVSFEFEPHYGMSSTLSRHLRRLAQCQNITTCSLGIDRPFWSDLGDDQTITLPCLQTLRVRRLSCQSHVRSVIDPLVLPQLQTLEIDATFPLDWWEPWHDHNFSNLLVRSGCALRHLSIQDVGFPSDEVVRCLALSRTLTSLRFIPCPQSQDITDMIRALDVSHPVPATVHGRDRTQGEGEHVVDGPLVPALREITLASSVEEQLSLMVEVCRSRGGARARSAEVSALQRVEAVFFHMPHVNAFPGDRFARVANVQREMARWVSEIESEREGGDEEGLEASVVVESSHLAEYVVVGA